MATTSNNPRSAALYQIHSQILEIREMLRRNSLIGEQAAFELLHAASVIRMNANAASGVEPIEEVTYENVDIVTADATSGGQSEAEVIVSDEVAQSAEAT